MRHVHWHNGAAAVWLAILAATFALAIYGRPLQHWVESLGLLRWFGVIIAAVLLALAVIWTLRIGRHLPRWRLALTLILVVALAGWGLTFDRPEEAMHLLIFGALGAIGTAAFGLPAALVLVPLCAGADELLQLYLPDRVGDWPDVTTNTIAGVVGWIAGWAQTRPRIGVAGASSEDDR